MQTIRNIIDKLTKDNLLSEEDLSYVINVIRMVSQRFECTHVLSSGKNKGKTCPKEGKVHFNNHTYCREHYEMAYAAYDKEHNGDFSDPNLFVPRKLPPLVASNGCSAPGCSYRPCALSESHCWLHLVNHEAFSILLEGVTLTSYKPEEKLSMTNIFPLIILEEEDKYYVYGYFTSENRPYLSMLTKELMDVATYFGLEVHPDVILYNEDDEE